MAQKIVRANGQEVKPAAEEGKKVTQTVKKAAEEGKKVNQTVKPAPPASNGSTVGLRIGAVVCWVLAIACEILCILALTNYFYPPFNKTAFLIIGILLDLGLAIAAAQMWKKANRIKPASEKNKAKFWLWNNMGLIMTILCFVPFIVLLLTNKNADKKMKVVGVACAAIMLIIGGLLGYDWNPVSAEQKEAAMAAITGEVLWTNSLGGKVYHTHEDCQALNRTEELVQGSVEQAIAANRTRLCSFCARRDAITTVVTDEVSQELLEQVAPEVTETPQEPAA